MKPRCYGHQVQGYSFFSVTAPGVFIEYELPTMLGMLEAMNDEEAVYWDQLVAAAQRYGARIDSSKHSRGPNSGLAPPQN